MDYRSKGTTTAVAIVTSDPDTSGNFVIEPGDDPEVVIEAAWSYLFTTFGGGTLVTKGTGEWSFQTRCDSQGANVTWLSDLSLTFTVPNAFDKNDTIFLEKLAFFLTSSNNFSMFPL